jgi:hypothetical protein
MRFQNNEFDDRIQERSKARMGKLKELMIFHMTSPNDAFRFVSNLNSVNSKSDAAVTYSLKIYVFFSLIWTATSV